MSHTRRGFIKAAGIGAAGAGVAIVAGNSVSADAAAPEATVAPSSVKGPIVVHVEDVRRGVMSVMVEGHEVQVTDRDLAARIAGALYANSPRAVNLPSA